MTDLDRLRFALTRSAGGSSDFDLNPGFILPPPGRLRPAGVLIAVWVHDGDPRVILTKRSSHLKHHPGQVAFPGGKVDATDRDARDAALREAEEEIGLPRERVQILGELPPHRTVTDFIVTPYIGVVEGAFDPIAEAGEVEEVFSVPLAHLLDVSRYQVQSRIWHGQLRRYFAVPYGPYYIWGATARILRGLADRAQTA